MNRNEQNQGQGVIAEIKSRIRIANRCYLLWIQEVNDIQTDRLTNKVDLNKANINSP